MSHNVLLTGASGYLGGSLLAAWKPAALSGFTTLYALVRTDAQAEAVVRYGAVPLKFNAYDKEEVRDAVVQHRITIVLNLIDAWKSDSQLNFLAALFEVQKLSGLQTHFVHTTGAKIFSEWAGYAVDEPLPDSTANLPDYRTEKTAHDLLKVPLANPNQPIETNEVVVQKGTELGIRTYLFVPCIVYGASEGFGNQISIQTADIVRAALATHRVYKLSDDKPNWPVCHIQDNTQYYIALIRAILNEKNPDWGANGHYLAASGSVVWDDLYEKVAQALKRRGRIEDDSVVVADKTALEAMARGLGCSKDFVAIRLAGRCSLTPEHGVSLGWKAHYPPKHILDEADAEVERILKHLDTSHDGSSK
ncbi:unnamed protein product [Clonostachys rosea]|uniref:NAD-dependent epimerase/dehydratase domain-containing protein n=1 Tax=Bionectria ochroleuca TaxID=29856 RepID=A0ABY6UEH4_BIOOC|nr:unnamed protein product [Clonostachys rosea]